MNNILPLLVVVGAMLAPYLLAAALTAAFPSLRRGFGQLPRTDAVVSRFFDGDTDANRIQHELDAIRTRFEGQDAGTVRS
jgi:hypothetical protein